LHRRDRGGTVIKAVSDLLPDATRSIVVEVVDLTSRSIVKGGDSVAQGGFGPTLPAAAIPLSAATFQRRARWPCHRSGGVGHLHRMACARRAASLIRSAASTMRSDSDELPTNPATLQPLSQIQETP